MDLAADPKAGLPGYVVGAYLFSVAAFTGSASGALSIIPQVLGAVVVGYALYDVLASFQIKIPASIGLYGLFGLWAAFTHYIGPRAGEGLIPSLGTLLKVVAATLACAQLIKTDADLFMSLRLFVFSILYVYYVNRGEIGLMQITGQVTEEDRFAGTLSNANVAAIFALIITWAAILLLVRAQKDRFKGVVYLLPVGVSLVLIYYSGSKKGLIGLALLVLFVTRLLFKRENLTPMRRGLIVLASAALILVAAYFIYTSPFFFRMQQLLAGLSNASDANRLELAREAVEVWLTNVRTFFVGVGFDSFWTHSKLGVYAHSTPLELLASTGIVGCALFLGFLGLLFTRFIGLYRKAAEDGSKQLFFAIEILLFIYTFFMATAVLYDAKELLPILGCLAGYGQYRLRQLGPSGTGGG